MPSSDLLAPLADAAIEAGAAILDIYHRGCAVERKGDGSPVTEADHAAEAIILRALGASFPGIPVVAEEECAAGRIPEVGARFFLVDPLDGTREFVGRNGEFTVNIALVEAGRATVGIVYAPCLGRLFAGSGETAWQGEVANGTVLRRDPIRVRPAPSEPVAVASRSHRTRETEAWLRRHAIRHVASRGSSLKFCLLAAGEADLYPRFGRTMEWDTAAGQAVLEAAGGQVVAPDGSPFGYGKAGPGGLPFENGDFLAFGAPELARFVLSR